MFRNKSTRIVVSCDELIGDLVAWQHGPLNKTSGKFYQWAAPSAVDPTNVWTSRGLPGVHLYV